MPNGLSPFPHLTYREAVLRALGDPLKGFEGTAIEEFECFKPKGKTVTEKRFRHESGHDGHRLNLDPADWRAHMTSSGEWRSIDDKIAGLAFCCPCGCGLEGWLPVNVEHGWEWDGNEERPTLSPSIKNPCGYHGYLKDGYFTPCVIG